MTEGAAGRGPQKPGLTGSATERQFPYAVFPTPRRHAVPTIVDLIQSIEIELEQHTKTRDRAVAEVKSILGRAQAESRAT